MNFELSAKSSDQDIRRLGGFAVFAELATTLKIQQDGVGSEFNVVQF